MAMEGGASRRYWREGFIPLYRYLCSSPAVGSRYGKWVPIYYMKEIHSVAWENYHSGSWWRMNSVLPILIFAVKFIWRRLRDYELKYVGVKVEK